MSNVAAAVYYQAEVEYRREQIRREWRPRARRRNRPVRNQSQEHATTAVA